MNLMTVTSISVKNTFKGICKMHGQICAHKAFTLFVMFSSKTANILSLSCVNSLCNYQ